MRFISDILSNYAEEHTTPEPPILQKLVRQTHLKILMPQMLSGHLQGALLQMMSQLTQPKRILEIGTYTGYSAICLCAGLQPDGILHTIDINEELATMQQEYFKESGFQDRIVAHLGDALQIIPTLEETFDLVFMDADKLNYVNYYELVFDKIRPGGLILADNVLWSGKVLEPKGDKEAKALHAFNEHIQKDDRVENLLLPIRDGIMMVRKL